MYTYDITVFQLAHKQNRYSKQLFQAAKMGGKDKKVCKTSCRRELLAEFKAKHCNQTADELSCPSINFKISRKEGKTCNEPILPFEKLQESRKNGEL